MAAHYSALEKMRLELTPEVLTQKAREIITRLGYPEHPADSAFGLNYDNDFQEFVEKNDKQIRTGMPFLPARPSLVHYWYRQSPDDMAAFGFQDQLLNPGIVKPDDPPTVLSGMINLELDPQGRLTYFQAIPPEKESAKETLGPARQRFDWNILFSAAGLDPTQFQKTEPQWNSLAASDSRMAWTGTWPGTKRPLRVEAAAWHGKTRLLLTHRRLDQTAAHDRSRRFIREKSPAEPVDCAGAVFVRWRPVSGHDGIIAAAGATGKARSDWLR